MMNMMINTNAYSLASLLAEDVNAPELRNPRNSAARSRGWLTRLFKRGR